MLSSHGYNHSDMVICQGIKDGFSLSSVLYELVLLKDAKLMGHCGLGRYSGLLPDRRHRLRIQTRQIEYGYVESAKTLKRSARS
mgnify:CR=1 FL=1